MACRLHGFKFRIFWFMTWLPCDTTVHREWALHSGSRVGPAIRSDLNWQWACRSGLVPRTSFLKFLNYEELCGRGIGGIQRRLSQPRFPTNTLCS